MGDISTFKCPLPLKEYPEVTLAHGGGGLLTASLIRKVFLAAFGEEDVVQHDSAVFALRSVLAAFTTDSFVVSPLFFPGGDIGSLAVNGTVNDLAMSGARPEYLSAAFILEEGLSMEVLWKVACSMGHAAREAGIKIVCGDTKVVDRGKGDGVFITTSGVGIIEHGLKIAPEAVLPGDNIILSGDLGRHGITVMCEREGLEVKGGLRSDCAPLWGSVKALIDGGVIVHCLRDLTRGGLASALNEIADDVGLEIEINESCIPVCDEVLGACEILGLDPLYVANEGRFVAFVPEAESDKAVELLTRSGGSPSCIGRVVGGSRGLVSMKSRLGTSRILDMISGEQLPRIC